MKKPKILTLDFEDHSALKKLIISHNATQESRDAWYALSEPSSVSGSLAKIKNRKALLQFK